MSDRLFEFIEHCPDAFVIVDTDGRIEMFNGLAERLFGYDRSEVAGQPIEILMPERFHAGHLVSRSEYLGDPCTRPMGAGMELIGRRKDGSEFPVEISLSPLKTDLGHKAVSAVRDITERRQAEEKLRRAKETSEKALADLTAAQENLVHAEKMASLGQLTAGIAHEIKNPLNFVNNFAETSVELLDELGETILPVLGGLPDDARAEAEDLLTTLRSDMGTIARHGARADGIMRSMLAHVRDDTSTELTDINRLVEEAYNLAFHSERASNPEFNVTLESSFDPAAGEIEAHAQDLTRVIVNLAGNAFHATEARKLASEDSYAPTVTLATEVRGDQVAIRIRDNGTGMPRAVIDKLFTPFFTTKPAGQGTGLGLSISYDIVVQQHGGTLDVESRENEFTEFVLVLPRHVTLGAQTANAGPSQ